MLPLNLYNNKCINVTTARKENYSFPVTQCTTALLYFNAAGTLLINNNLVYQGTGVHKGTYYVRLGASGKYRFYDKLNLFNSSNDVGIIQYEQDNMEKKQIQLVVGNINNTTQTINLTGAIKFHIIHDTDFSLYINGVEITGTSSGNNVIVIDIGNDINVINDNITITTTGITGYIIERLI